MKESKLKDMVSIEVVKTQIWSIFDALRKEPISSEDYYIVLFLLSAYKDGLSIEELEANLNGKQSFDASVYNVNEIKLKQYLSIIQNFEPTLTRLRERGLANIIHALQAIDKKVLSENFTDIFDSALFRLTQSQGRYGGEFIQPIELTRFICGLADLPEKSKVFNPFAGLASFGVYFDQGLDYFGQELNEKTWALGTLRIMAYQRVETAKYFRADSILHWPKPSEKFDLIVSNPPYGVRLGQYYKDVAPEIRTIELFLIEKGLHSLNERGKLIALLPQGFLFSGMHEQRLRKHLVDEDLIDTIVSLPGGLLLNTAIPLVILVINKAKKIPGKVRFIDAKNFVGTNNPREKVLNDIALKNVINSVNQDHDVIRIVSNEQIKSKDYILNVPRYFQKEVVGIKLGDVLKFVKGPKGNLLERGKLVRIRDLKEDRVDFKLDIQTIEEIELPTPNVHLADESCLLLASRWKTLKPTYFEFDGTPIALNTDVFSFKVNESIVNKAYLINELHSEYVQEQLESYRLGTSIPFIRREDLLKVVVNLIPLEEQRAKIQGINELSDKIKSLQEERNRLVHGRSVKHFSEFASLKHTLGRPRQNILDWSDNILHFLKSKRDEFTKLNKTFAEFYEIDIISALKEIKRDVNFITDILEKGENGLIVEEFKKQLIHLSDINDIVNSISNNGFNFKLKKHLVKGEKLKNRGVLGNTTLFKTLFDNILINASKYGFDKKSIENEVIIELGEVDDMLLVEVKNNGKSFPENFDREKFIMKYSTANTKLGTGLGGYDINRIATYFENEEWELVLNENPFYPVKFKFQFSIKPI